METYLVPAEQARAEIRVINSRFIATAAPACSVDEARDFIRKIRAEFSDATHHVPAYIIGHGSSTITHCNDDREPAGTAGRPALAVLKGSGLGDVAVVVTRFFGGTKLGAGGLVRAYGDAVRAVLGVLPLARKVLSHTCMIALPYGYYERIDRLISAHQGRIIDKEFGSDVVITAIISVAEFIDFNEDLQGLSRGAIRPEIIKENHPEIIPITSADNQKKPGE